MVCPPRLWISGQNWVLSALVFFFVAVLLVNPQSVAAQSVGPSGCVANCGTGGGGGGNRGGGSSSYDPYAGMAAGALGAFMQGFMNQMLKQPSPKQQAYALNKQGNAAYNRDNNAEAVRLYEAALRLSPYDSVIRNNLKNARKAARFDREQARRKLEEQRKEAEAKRKMDMAKRNVSQILGDFSQKLDAAESSGPELALMSFDDPIQNTSDLDQSKEHVGKRSEEIEDKILKAPPGKSAWDGGHGGTLDSPEAAGVSKPATGVGTPPVQTGGPSQEKTKPATPTDIAMLGARVSKEEKAKNAEASVSIAGMLAKKGDYDGALRYLKEAKRNNPDQPGINETIAYVKGLKAADSPELAARLKKSPSPKAEIILDALTVGDGDWESSIRYLEGMKQKDPNDPHVQEALGYIREMHARQVSAGGQLGIDQINVPSPKLEPRETLDEWVHANWSKAPDYLKKDIQRNLRNPKVLKELVKRNQIALLNWRRDATRESAGKKLVKTLTDPDAEWRVKAQAWRNDPMHQKWLGDAALISLSPLGPEIILRASKSTGAVVRPNFTRTWEYYNFPTLYRGKEPNIPRSLFGGKNPYKHIHTGKETWEGSGTSVWMDAAEVWIKRTPALDKELQWVLKLQHGY